MSDDIPLELQDEIIKRVPVKPLLKFRSVSKQWKSLIDSPEFADDYCLRQAQRHRMLIRYIPFEQNDPDIPKYTYVSIADDDDTFQQHQIPSTTFPLSVNNLRGSRIVGSSHGLFCLCGYHVDRPFPYDYKDRSYMAVIWNPCIRKFVDVPLPNVVFQPYETILGFGVSPQTKDPKIVKVNNRRGHKFDTSVPILWRFEVFSLSSGTWKTPSCSRNNPPCRNSIIFDWSQVVHDGAIYWLAQETINVDGEFHRPNLIMSFDLSSEVFEELCLPDNLAHLDELFISISKRMESVVVVGEIGNSIDVWMMGQGVTKSFTKLFTIMPRVSLPASFRLCGFMKNGEPIVDHGIVDHGSDALFIYDPYSERIKDFRIVGKTRIFTVTSYMETLLLIDQ